MHRFPIKDRLRLQRWIINAGNANLIYLDEQSLKNRYICSQHFTEDDYIKGRGHRLKLTTVPISYKTHHNSSRDISSTTLHQETLKNIHNEEENVAIKEEETTSLQISPNEKTLLNELIDFPSETIQLHKQIKKKLSKNLDALNTQVINQSKKLKNKNLQISKMRKKINCLKKLKSVIIFNTMSCNSKYSKTLALMQSKRKQRKWSKYERDFSLMLFYKSPLAYSFLKKLNIVLPGISTIRRWLGNSKLKQKFAYES